MKLQEIERVLEKYYRGETSLEEEKMLKAFFAGTEVRAHLQADKELFKGFSAEKELDLQDVNFDSLVMRKVRGKESLIFRLAAKRRWLYATAGTAAAILILLAIVIRFEPVPKRFTDTYTNPETAYREAKKVLLFVSAQLNRGTHELQPISAYSDGMGELNSLKTFDDGINSLEKINKYNKIEKIVKNSEK